MSAQRMLFVVIATMISSGIFLTGFNQVHWLLYVPVVGMLFAAASGYCPGIAILKKIGFK